MGLHIHSQTITLEEGEEVSGDRFNVCCIICTGKRRGTYRVQMDNVTYDYETGNTLSLSLPLHMTPSFIRLVSAPRDGKVYINLRGGK